MKAAAATNYVATDMHQLDVCSHQQLVARAAAVAGESDWQFATGFQLDEGRFSRGAGAVFRLRAGPGDGWQVEWIYSVVMVELTTQDFVGFRHCCFLLILNRSFFLVSFFNFFRSFRASAPRCFYFMGPLSPPFLTETTNTQSFPGGRP